LVQRRIFARAEASARRDESFEDSPLHPSQPVPSQETESWSNSGSIVIPAASFVEPSKNTKTVIAMKSFLGGDQLHLENDGKVVYSIPPLPLVSQTSNSFQLTCRLVTIHRSQVPLELTIEQEQSRDGNACGLKTRDVYSIEVKYTRGEWKQMQPISVQILPNCATKLTVERTQPCHGVTIKEFTFTSL